MVVQQANFVLFSTFLSKFKKLGFTQCQQAFCGSRTRVDFVDDTTLITYATYRAFDKVSDECGEGVEQGVEFNYTVSTFYP